MLAASIAVCKAQALINNLYPYELIAYLSQKESVVIPFALFNVLNGGAHANNSLAIQEFMILPTGAKTFRQSLEQAMTIFHALAKILAKQGKSIAVGDEGGFAPMGIGEYEALDLIMEAIATSGIDSPNDVVIGLDVAATQFYDPQTQLYQWQGKKVDVDVLIDFYGQLINKYPIYSIEDPCAESDYIGWKKMMVQTGDKIHIVGDDVFSTNMAHLTKGITEGLVDAAIIKLNQIGTVTETLQAVDLCKENDIITIVSHRSGETNDDFIVDLAVGTNSGFLKAGGCSRGERMAKYNRLLKIEDDLLFSSL
jgi:enolase